MNILNINVKISNSRGLTFDFEVFPGGLTLEFT